MTQNSKWFIPQSWNVHDMTQKILKKKNEFSLSLSLSLSPLSLPLSDYAGGKWNKSVSWTRLRRLRETAMYHHKLCKIDL